MSVATISLSQTENLKITVASISFVLTGGTALQYFDMIDELAWSVILAPCPMIETNESQASPPKRINVFARYKTKTCWRAV